MSGFLSRLMTGRRRNLETDNRQDNSLTLQHLKRVYHEYLQDRSIDLFVTVPLFNRAFENVSPVEIPERFRDVESYSYHITALFVSEIKKRAARLSTEEACMAIAEFLEIGSTENPSYGWQLFTAIDILVAGSDLIINSMAKTSITSTLVKCLYLFIDLPQVKLGQGSGDVTPAESRFLLQKTVTQVLVRLCSHITPIEELRLSGDLPLLFTAVSSPCLAYNHMWRKSASEVLMRISRFDHTGNKLVLYIHDKKCIADTINNIQMNKDMSALEIVEVLVTVFCFLKDSSEVSQVLLEDFRSCDGYSFLVKFLLLLEDDSREETIQALRNLALLIGSFTTVGHEPINPVTDPSLTSKLAGFVMPKPMGKGVSVRNIQAFKVLHTVFLQSKTSHLCSMILDTISGIFHQDNANYFILEPQATLPEFAEVIHTKPEDIQTKYFELIDFIVTSLNFVPVKELNGLSLLLKANRSLECSLKCMKTINKVLDSANVYKKVFNEVGLLEVLITCLHRFASRVKEMHADETAESGHMTSIEKDLGFMVMNSLAVLLTGTSGTNAASYVWSLDVYHQKHNEDVFRQCGGARCAHNLVPYEFCRRQSLSLVKQLLLSSKGDDDLGTLLCLMQKEPPESIKIKIDILKVIVSAMRESHRTRSMFKKVDGFKYVMAVLVTMEGSLGTDVSPAWSRVEKLQILSLIQVIFCTMTVAMRHEPANVKVFKTEVQFNSLIATLRNLGCFTKSTRLELNACVSPTTDPLFKELFMSSTKLDQFCVLYDGVPTNLTDACFILRCVYDMALDHFDLRVPEPKHAYKRMTSMFSQSDSGSGLPLRSSWNGSIDLVKLDDDEHSIVHPGAITVMLNLLPAIDSSSDQICVNLHSHITTVIRSLMYSEHNQQVMCADGFIRELLNHCSYVLIDERHPLHANIQYTFELLASQSLQPNDLRDYLRLGSPLCCAPLDEWISSQRGSPDLPAHGGTIPVNRVRCLVTMTTPRDVGQNGSSVVPPFVEFNMAHEGYGYLFMPSIAPQGPPNPSVVGVTGSVDNNIIGGAGQGERIFPPASGLSFSSWICIERPSSAENHLVWLLQIQRKLADSPDSLMCLRAAIDTAAKNILICTKESKAEDPLSDSLASDSFAKIWCPQIVQGTWHHITLVFARAGMLKNSSVSFYLNGSHVSSQKLHYISPNIGSSNSGTAQSTTTVHAYIGTPAAVKSTSSLIWRQGSFFLVEEALSQPIVERIYSMGPAYTGCLQAVPMAPDNHTVALISEERIMLSVNASSTSLMTVSKIKRLYNKHDSKSISNQLSTTSIESTTPVRVFYNSAGHLSGCARSLGAVLIGHNGVHTFIPQPVAAVLNYIGSMSIMLGFVAMALDIEGLYASVKALVCVLKSSKAAQHDMTRINGYQLLAMLYKRKQTLLNSHILHLTFSLAGTIDSNKEITVIPNRLAFEDLLCDLEVWHDAPSDLQRSLYEHFYELLTEASGRETNKLIMRQARLLKKILYVMRDCQLTKQTLAVLCSVLRVLLYDNTNRKDILRFGQFVVSTVPDGAVIEDQNLLEPKPGCALQLSHNISLRNSCLSVVKQLVFSNEARLDSWVVNCMIPTLGCDWFLVFMQSHLHRTTVVTAVEILLGIIRHADFFSRFRDGVMCGGWLENSHEMLDDRLLHGVNLDSGLANKASNGDTNMAMSQLPGFVCLQWLMSSQSHISELYYMLGSFLVNEKIECPSSNQMLTLDGLTDHFLVNTESDTKKHQQKMLSDNWLQEPAVIMLSMVKAIINMPWQNEEEGSWMREYPITIVQLFQQLYFKYSNSFRPIAMSSDFLCALAGALFQQKSKRRESSSTSSPTNVSGGDSNTESIEFNRSMDYDEAVSKEYKPVAVLSDHPVRKLIIDLVMRIILESFALPPSKNIQVVEIVLNTCPLNCSRREKSEFQTAILKLVMDHLLAADVLLGEQAAIQYQNGGSYSNTVAHVFFFTNLVVDKLWHGCYNKDAREIFEFVKELLAQGKRRASGLSLDLLYSCLNRTILFELSRETDTLARQTAMLETLRRLRDNRSLVFGPGNFDLEFIGCLSHCLLELTSSRHQVRWESAQTHWHVTSVSADAAADVYDESITLLENSADRIWQELYVHKKPAIEESLKINLTSVAEVSSMPRITTPPLNSLRDRLTEPSARIWNSFIESQKKSSVRDVERFHKQIQSRLERVGSGMLNLATGKKTVKELPAMKQTPISQFEYDKWLKSHTSLVRELVQHNMTTYELDNQHMHAFIHEAWLKTERELLRERGVWGPPCASALDKFQLDMTEGPLRMRMKMERNEEFYQHYASKEKNFLRPHKHKAPVSSDSDIYNRNRRVQSLIEQTFEPDIQLSSSSISVDVDQDESLADSLLKTPNLLPKKALMHSDTGDDEESGELAATEKGNSADASSTPQEPLVEESVKTNLENHQTLLRLLDEGEKIGPMYRCARIQGLDSFEGIVMFGRESYYILDGFTLQANNEIQDIDSLLEEFRNPIIPRVQSYTSQASKKETATTKKTCIKFCYEDIREVLKRRYLLQPMALEIFNSDGRTILLAFEPNTRNTVFSKLNSVAPSLTINAQQSVAGQKQTTKVEPRQGLFSGLTSEKSVTSRWERGEISNFQYLMHLNTLAGRSYNDLMQYPVFPWILADYESEKLDLTNASTFRDLSKPMGAQTQTRLQQFMKRFKEWDDPAGETPPYHYGTHYSSAMIVASYLVRMEPFTQHFLRLQGGHFDLADRMFHTVKDAYESAARTNMADVKELIPEFFYLPDFLLNVNKFDLGEKQSGVRLNHVGLPPWAKGDPREFVRVHREALECEYVSSHLHEWIDLIFGYKQQGQPAVDACNVFHYLFYEGNVDIYSIDDPLKRNAIIGFINNFGQTPKQLFKKPHPQKKTIKIYDSIPSTQTTYSTSSASFFFRYPESLQTNKLPVKVIQGPVGQIVCTDRLVLAVSQTRVLIPPQFNRYLAWGLFDFSLRICNYDSDKVAMVFENLGNSEIVCACSPNSRTIITAGSSTVINVWSITESRGRGRAVLQQPLYGHTAGVLCLAVSPIFNVLVSGSCDKTCIVWDLSRLCYRTQLANHVGPVTALCINDMNGVIASCASSWLYIWSVNGELLASIDTSNNAGHLDINCVTMSLSNDWDLDNVIMTGGSDGVVRMWSLRYVEVSRPQKLQRSSEVTEQAGEEMVTRDPTVMTTNQPNDKKDENPVSPDLSRLAGVPPAASETDSSNRSVVPMRGTVEVKTPPVPSVRASKNRKVWQRTLVYRHRLTLPKDKDPQQITAIACSRDHRTVFFGDSKGRIFSSSMVETNGVIDHWVRDEEQDKCFQCNSEFNIYLRRHHCRKCGNIFCQKCSEYQTVIPELKFFKPTRVCVECYKTLKNQTTAKVGEVKNVTH